MEDTNLIPVTFDVGKTISSVVNGPHRNAVVFGCTICALAVIAGYCYLTAEGHQVVLPLKISHIQVGDGLEEPMR